jgi:hypothetical protein
MNPASLPLSPSLTFSLPRRFRETLKPHQPKDSPKVVKENGGRLLHEAVESGLMVKRRKIMKRASSIIGSRALVTNECFTTTTKLKLFDHYDGRSMWWGVTDPNTLSLSLSLPLSCLLSCFSFLLSCLVEGWHVMEEEAGKAKTE